MKFVRPLYRELFASSIGRKTALDTFAEWKTNYHPIASKMLAQDLKVSPPAAVTAGAAGAGAGADAAGGGLQGVLASPVAMLGLTAAAIALVKRASL